MLVIKPASGVAAIGPFSRFRLLLPSGMAHQLLLGWCHKLHSRVCSVVVGLWMPKPEVAVVESLALSFCGRVAQQLARDELMALGRS